MKIVSLLIKVRVYDNTLKYSCQSLKYRKITAAFIFNTAVLLILERKFPSFINSHYQPLSVGIIHKLYHSSFILRVKQKYILVLEV